MKKVVRKRETQSPSWSPHHASSSETFSNSNSKSNFQSHRSQLRQENNSMASGSFSFIKNDPASPGMYTLSVILNCDIEWIVIFNISWFYIFSKYGYSFQLFIFLFESNYRFEQPFIAIYSPDAIRMNKWWNIFTIII